MDVFNYNDALYKLSCELDNKRYIHTLGVSYTASCLAMCHQPQLIEKARIAGLLHDCSKRYSNNEFINLCDENNIPINEFELRNPGLLHAKYSSYLAKTEYGVKDNDILESIACHTTGKPNMNLLDKIIYIADYIEPERIIQPRLETIRKEAFINIDSALFMILDDTISYLTSQDKIIDNITEETYLFYKGLN